MARPKKEESKTQDEQKQDNSNAESLSSSVAPIDEQETKEYKTVFGETVNIPKPKVAKNKYHDTTIGAYFVHAYGKWQYLNKFNVTQAATDPSSKLVVPEETGFDAEKLSRKKK